MSKGFKLDGPPITPELQEVFGHFGMVTGVMVLPNASIVVHYEGGVNAVWILGSAGTAS